MTNETIAKEVAEKISEVGNLHMEWGDEAEAEVVKLILEALARSQSSEWIPVETRLPEDSELYLVMVERVDEQPLRDIGWYDDRGWHTRSHLTTVTHWTLLPSAPKETR